jgi:hypothetical protein
MAITAMPVTRFVAGGDSESPGQSIGNAFGTGLPNVERRKSSALLGSWLKENTAAVGYHTSHLKHPAADLQAILHPLREPLCSPILISSARILNQQLINNARKMLWSCFDSDFSSPV